MLLLWTWLFKGWIAFPIRKITNHWISAIHLSNHWSLESELCTCTRIILLSQSDVVDLSWHCSCRLRFFVKLLILCVDISGVKFRPMFSTLKEQIFEFP